MKSQRFLKDLWQRQKRDKTKPKTQAAERWLADKRGERET